MLFFLLEGTFHFRFRHCHSVARRFRCEKGIFFIHLFFFRKVHITSVSVTVTVSQEGFRERRVFFLYIFFSLGRHSSLPFSSLSQCRKKVSVCEGYLFYTSFFFFRKVHITSVSVTVTVSQEGFRVNAFSLFFRGGGGGRSKNFTLIVR